MAQIPNLKFDKNKAYLTEQLDIQKSNRNNVSDIIANIKFINSSYNCNQYYLEDLLKTGDELITSFDSNVATIDKLTEDLNKITTSLSEILSPENQKSKTKSYFIKSFTELEKGVTEYSKKFNDLVQKIDNDNTTYSTFIASCNLNSAVDAAISDNPDDILKIMQANLIEKDNIFSDIANSGADEDIDDDEDSEDDSETEDTNDTDNEDKDDEIQEESSLYEETVDYASEEDAGTKSKSKSKTKAKSKSKSKSKSDSDSKTKAKTKTTTKSKTKSKTSEDAEPSDEDEKDTKNKKGTKKASKKTKNDSNVFEELTDTDEEGVTEEIPSTEGVNDSDNTDDSKETNVPVEMNDADDNTASEDTDNTEEIDSSATDKENSTEVNSDDSDEKKENSSTPVSITDELRDILDNMDSIEASEDETKDAISQGVQGLIDASFNFTVRELKNNNEDFYDNINSMISEYDDFSVPISKIGSARAAESQKNASEENKEKTDEQTSPLKPIHINNNNFYNYDNSSYSYTDIEKARKEKNTSKPLDITDYTAKDMANKTIFLSTDEVNARLSKDNTAPTEKLEDLNIEDLVKGTASINNGIFADSSVTSDTIVLNNSESVLENINNIVPEETVKVDTIKLNNEKANTFESIVDNEDTIIDDNDISLFNDYGEGLASLDEVESLADALNNSDNVSITMEDKETNVETVVKSSVGDYNQDQALSKEKIEKIIRAEADNETLIISEKNNKIYLPYKMSEINNYINSYPGTYTGPSDVVKQEFILDLSDFMKHPSRTRFQETYTLIRNRDGKSVASAILYGLKLTKKSNLSPAVIAACKHQDELEVYLNCLNENKLSDFKAFNIIYEINPLKGQKNI